jgi:DNA-directed RNA polymerase specialized sigma24 family protein
MADPPPSYAEVGAALAMPLGSIGPVRARCLAALRGQLEKVGILSAGSGS